MGKKGSWFSAIKRVFTHSSKDKPTNGPGSDKKSSKEKKGKGILRHGETKSFLFREPSSIEKILGEADQLLIRPTTILERPTSTSNSPPRVAPSSPKAKSPPRISSPKPRTISPPKIVPPRAFTPEAASSNTAPPIPIPKVSTQSKRKDGISNVPRPEPTLRNQHLSATKIQAAYRGYLARRSFRALRGLVRLQEVMRGQNVKRQTMNAMKKMQLLVRVQTQIQSRRIQMLETRNDKEVDTALHNKWSQLSEAGNNEDWDDSVLTKDEAEARLQKKVEAVIKRERAMAYAYSHKLWKSNPKAAQGSLDIRSNGYPWWWNWLERQLPPTTTSQSQIATKSFTLTPPRPISEYKPSPRLHEAHTPQSSKSSIPTRAKQFQTPSRTPPPSIFKNSKPRASAANSTCDASLKDDDSLMSCPPFSAHPNYMTPTVSAKAKARANSNPKERLIGTPSNDSKRRFSFPLTPNIGSFKWNKGSNKISTPQRVSEKPQSPHSVGDMSLDSAVSMPARIGRKPFNRFV
ncbi:hypothetical protein RD792_009796 [Penstemon davidsonii]|uniref:DUF4005 domain-containing protein n=1 Tax=Penstemon davidsonii TaxID=160366 RepID=A0ABR0D017_9LAMI|nr:hypothetical protein RD792_009796 [Penstemon davidsonii]